MGNLKLAEGYPILDEAFQSTIPGLFFAGPPATRDFGPCFGFVIGSRPAARIIIDKVRRRLRSMHPEPR